MPNTISFLIAEHRRNPWIVPGVAMTAAAALGSVLPDLIALAHRVMA